MFVLEAADGGRIGSAEQSGPLEPAGLEILRQCAISGELHQGPSLGLAKNFELWSRPEISPDSFKRLHFQSEHRVAINGAVPVQCPSRHGQGRDGFVDFVCAGDIFNSQIKRI